jgi:HEAT repeat protein
LIDFLKTGDPPTKVEALFTLGAIGQAAQPAVPVIITQLSDNDPRVAQAAGFALGKIGPGAKEAVPALAKLNNSQDELLRMTSIWAILKIGPPSEQLTKTALPILSAALKNNREFVRIEAAMTLGDLGKGAAAAIPDLEAAANDSSAAVRSAVTAAIKKIKG